MRNTIHLANEIYTPASTQVCIVDEYIVQLPAVCIDRAALDIDRSFSRRSAQIVVCCVLVRLDLVPGSHTSRYDLALPGWEICYVKRNLTLE